MKTRKYFLCLLIILCRAGYGQGGVCIFPGQPVMMMQKDTIAIYGSVFNRGTLITAENGFLYFMGEKWVNEQNARMLDQFLADNSVRGNTVQFSRVGSSVNAGPQFIDGGYQANTLIGPSFSRLLVDNKDGVWLTSGLNVVKELGFLSGHLYLSGKTAVLGNDTESGNITGFNQDSYVVTGETPGTSRLMIRNMKKDRDYIFPLGERAEASMYHPVRITPATQSEDIMASVFMGTYRSGNVGARIQDSTINTTWYFEKLRASSNQFNISLQHNNQNEGAFFSANKQKSYVSLFYNGVWKPISAYGPPVGPGMLTSGSPLAEAAMNTGSLEMASPGGFYLSKFSSETNNSAEVKAFNVFTPNGDGQNDYFEITHIDNYPDNEVVIYNRWNNEVFKTKGYSSSNRFTGKGLPDGTYFYVISIQAGTPPVRKIFKGYVTIVR